MNKLDQYDTNKLKQALALIEEVRDYNYQKSSSLSKKLDTIHDKLDMVIKTEQDPNSHGVGRFA